MDFVEDNNDGYGLYTRSILALFVILLLSALIVAPQLLREHQMGMDSYYYLHYAGNPQPGMPPVFFHLAQYDPVALSLLFTFLMLAVFYLICNQLGVANAILPPVLLLAAPSITFRMALGEDDLMGIVVCLLAILFYLKAQKNRLWYLGVAALLPMYFLVWRGIALFFVMIAFHEIVKRCKYAWGLLPLLYLQFTPDNLVGEQSWGFIFAPIVLLGLLTGLKGWNKTELFIRAWAGFFLAVGIFQAKYLWFAAFPLAIMLVDALKSEDKKKVQTLLIVMLGVGFFMGAQMVIQSQPTSQQMADYQEIANLTDSIDNSWHYGHHLRYHGIEPLNDNLHPEWRVPDVNWENEWALSHIPLGDDYRLVKNFTWSLLYQRVSASSHASL